MWLRLWKLSSGHMVYQNVCVVIMGHHLHQNWPQSNGKVERCNDTLLKIVQIAQLEGRDWWKAVQDLMSQYRVTPHTVTGISPAELLMGRKLRD